MTSSAFDFVHDDGLPFDDQGHGTHTAGTIGAVGGNGKGTSGVAQRVSIMAVKFLSADGSGNTADAIKAIDYAVAHGAKVLSNSWGGAGDEDNKALLDAIHRAKTRASFSSRPPVTAMHSAMSATTTTTRARRATRIIRPASPPTT